MNSPVLNILSSYIRLNRTDITPIYLQIAHGIINAIHTKALNSSAKLPGTRMLSESLYVHRKTVIAAYDELSAQGWVDIIPQKGAFVSSKKLRKNTSIQVVDSKTSKNANFPLEKNIILDSPFHPIHTDYYFTEGTIDHRLVPFKTINQLFSSIVLKKTTNKILNRDFYVENENLKNQLINYLHITNDLSVNNSQLVITNNNQTALHTIIQTVLKPNDKIIILEPGNFSVHMKFKQAQIDIVPIKLDTNGIKLEHLKSLLQTHKIRAIYIQTNHLYPTIDSLGEKQKKTLLELANIHEFIIIEDNNTGDFVYEKSFPNSLRKLDTQGSVIHLNSLQNLLPAPYNIGYIIAPENSIPELIKTKNSLQSHSNYLVEETITAYIKEGLLIRQVQKNTKTYLKRRDNFQQLLIQHLEQNINFEIPKSGLAFWVTFNSKLPLLSISKYCETQNLTLPGYLLYQNQHVTGIRLGFGHLNELEAEQAVAILSKAIYKHLY